MPASIVKGFRSEVPFSYIQTSLFTWRPSASKTTSVAVHIHCMSLYQTYQIAVEKLNVPCPFLIIYLPTKGLYCSIKQKWWCSWDGENESELCRLMWELSCAHFSLQVLVRRVHVSASVAQTPLRPMLPACLPRLAHPFKTSCPSPQRCPLLDLAGSHSVWSPTPPHISAALPRPPLWVLVFSETPISSDP